jgi:hypothetical protein
MSNRTDMVKKGHKENARSMEKKTKGREKA